MIPIQLYKPNEVDLTIDFPTDWNELSHVELCIVAKAFFSGNTSAVELFIAILSERIGKNANKIILLLNPEDVAIEYSALVANFLSAITRTASFTIPGAKHAIPENFESTTVGQYEEADQHLVRYLSDKLAQDLELFYKALFSTTQVASIANMQACALYFLGCKAQLPTMFPLVFGGKNNATPSAPDPMALTKLIHHGAGPKNGTREQIRNMPIHEFLYDCQLEAEKAPDVF